MPGPAVARRIPTLLALALSGFVACGPAPAAPRGTGDPLAPGFARARPFFERYCFGCHGGKKPKGDLDLTRDFTLEDLAKNPRRWEAVRLRLRDGEMPPDDAKALPGPGERADVLAFLRDVEDREARRHAGDPGPVLARRLSNAEYDYSIRDLTGVDLRPTREFPVDPANEAGFDNSGESLTMSEALLRKYLAAARSVADHAVLKPDGFVFAPHPVVTDTDRDKYCVQRIVAFYQRHEVNLAAYFAALRGGPRAGLSPKYLAALEALLAEPRPPAAPRGSSGAAGGRGRTPRRWPRLRPACGRSSRRARRSSR